MPEPDAYPAVKTRIDRPAGKCFIGPFRVYQHTASDSRKISIALADKPGGKGRIVKVAHSYDRHSRVPFDFTAPPGQFGKREILWNRQRVFLSHAAGNIEQVNTHRFQVLAVCKTDRNVRIICTDTDRCNEVLPGALPNPADDLADQLHGIAISVRTLIQFGIHEST